MSDIIFWFTSGEMFMHYSQWKAVIFFRTARKGRFCSYSPEGYSISGYSNVSCHQKCIITHHECYWIFKTVDYKGIENLYTFKNKIKKWKPKNRPWIFCKFYINNIDFVWERKRNLKYSVALGEVFLSPAGIFLLEVQVYFLNF